mmetsp:Transcript_105440/g.263970  ORF Transcript_105440/g.263970 Transcript_105440/m.263970 type:complete len:441 (+) Transcript_105440:92-1414(+)
MTSQGQQPFLTAGNNGQARVLFNNRASEPGEQELVGRAVATDATAPATGVTQAATGADIYFQQLKRRVIYLAIAMAALAVIHHLVEYIAGVAEIESVFDEVRKVAPESMHKHLKHLPGSGAMFASGFHKVVVAVVVSLIVPFCGYFGAKQHNPGLMCAFCGCNACFACCATMTVLISGFGLTLIHESEPRLERWLQQCDPSLCLGLSGANQTIDCLAGLGRTPLYLDIPHMKASCPQAFLDCPNSLDDPCMYYHGMPCTDQQRTMYCNKWQHNRAECGFSGRCMPTEDACLPIGLPTEPSTATCTVNHDQIDTFHAVIELLPVVAPKFAALLAVKMFLTIPAVILGCLGFCWGWALHDRLSAGYAYVAEPGLRTQEMQVQPHMMQPQVTQPQAVQLQPPTPVLQVPVPGIVLPSDGMPATVAAPQAATSAMPQASAPPAL